MSFGVVGSNVHRPRNRSKTRCQRSWPQSQVKEFQRVNLSTQYCGWTKSISHHFETMVETFVCWHLQGKHQKPGFLRWCERDFVHPQYHALFQSPAPRPSQSSAPPPAQLPVLLGRRRQFCPEGHPPNDPRTLQWRTPTFQKHPQKHKGPKSIGTLREGTCFKGILWRNKHEGILLRGGCKGMFEAVCWKSYLRVALLRVPCSSLLSNPEGTCQTTSPIIPQSFI